MILSLKYMKLIKEYRIAGLGPSRDASRVEVAGVFREVPGRAAVAMVSSVKIDSAIPSSNISRKSTLTSSVRALVFKLHTA